MENLILRLILLNFNGLKSVNTGKQETGAEKYLF